jgi:hypothetical protein
MVKKIDTSINVEKEIIRKLDNYGKLMNLTRKQIIIKIFSHLVKKTKNAVFMVGPTVMYQAAGCKYHKLTLHLTLDEMEMIKQIRMVTLCSVSLVFFIAMKFFGEKILSRVSKSSITNRIFSSYNNLNNYPGYFTFIENIQKKARTFVRLIE